MRLCSGKAAFVGIVDFAGKALAGFGSLAMATQLGGEGFSNERRECSIGDVVDVVSEAFKTLRDPSIWDCQSSPQSTRPWTASSRHALSSINDIGPPSATV